MCICIFLVFSTTLATALVGSHPCKGVKVVTLHNAIGIRHIKVLQ